MSITLGCGYQATPMDGVNADAILTELIQERGRLSGIVWQGIRLANPLLRMMEATKEFFPEGMGDVLTRPILDVSHANELTALNWGELKAAKPGSNPCCWTFNEITYGSRQVSACLYKYGEKTPQFCKLDLAFKYKREEQVRQLAQVWGERGRSVWGHWATNAYQKSVCNVTINASYGHPEEHGTYPAFCTPASILTYQHLEMLYVRIKAASGELGVPVQGHQMIVIGEEEFAELDLRYQKSCNAIGRQGDEVSIPDLGSVRRIGKYLFLLTDAPRRYRQPAAGESWDACIIPSTIMAPSFRGEMEMKNPDYHNPSIAVFTETLWFNQSAINWLVPPSAMTGATGLHPAANFSGEFIPVRPSQENDPFQLNVYFVSAYIAGTISNFPKRGRAILHLSVHQRPCDITLDGPTTGLPAEPTKYFIRDAAKLITAGHMQFLIKGTLPGACPLGTSLFAVTRAGKRFLIDSVASTTAFAGDAINPAGTVLDVVFPTSIQSAATVRDCDPWDYIACLPAATMSNTPDNGGCTACGDDDAAAVCVLRSVFYSDNIVNVKNSAGTNLLSTASYTASTFKTALDTWMGSNGGGTSTVTAGDATNGWRWEVAITGAAGTALTTLRAAQGVTFDAGLNTGLAAFKAYSCD